MPKKNNSALPPAPSGYPKVAINPTVQLFAKTKKMYIGDSKRKSS